MHIQKYPTPVILPFLLAIYIYTYIGDIPDDNWMIILTIYLYFFFSVLCNIGVISKYPHDCWFYPSFHTFSPAVLSFRNRLLLIDISEPIRVRGKVAQQQMGAMDFWTGWLFFCLGLVTIVYRGIPFFDTYTCD